MPRFSTKTVNAMLIKATGIKGYVPQGLKTAINRTKISSNFGQKRVKDVLGGKSNPNIDQNTLNKIFEKIDETGALKTSWAESKEKFTREVAKQQRIEDRQQQINKQIEQKSQQNTKNNTNKAALENQKNQVKNKKPETVKPEDEKASNIAASRLETERAKRGRGIGSISKLEQVREAQSKFRETYGKSSEIGVKSRGGGGMATEERSGGLIGHAVKEGEKDEKNLPKGNKSGQKGGGNVSTNQKNSGRQGVSIMGTTGIDQLTHPKEISGDENIPTGGIRVKELENKPPASQPETSPAPRSASAPEDILDMDI